jgi:DHA1 family multidrug resistance protein-like MFS transporter
MKVNWKRNLVFAWLSQVLSLMGFAFAMPFAAFYIQKDLGISDPVKAKVWVGAFEASAYISLAVMAPIWGILADRYGRKLMMLRANFGSAFFVALMAFAPNVQAFMVLRLIQGAFTGTVSAAQTLVASYTPDHRQGMALGTMSSAVFAGLSLGNWLGGEFAYRFGYKNAFLLAGAILFLSGLIVVLGIQERFQKETNAEGDRPSRISLRGIAGPILLLLAVMAFVARFDAPMLPFLVQEIHGEVKGAELWVSRVNVLYCVGAFLAGFIWGWVADRVAAPKMARVCAVATGACMIPQALATAFAPLMGGRLGMAFFGGGLDPVFQIWLARVTPAERRGSIFGWAVTAKSVGWGLSPCLSVLVGVVFGVRSCFFVSAVLFVLLIPLIDFVAGKVSHPATNNSAPRNCA